MKLYLSSIGIPTPADLAQLLDSPLEDVSVALIPNAKDYYAQRAWDFKIRERIESFEALGMNVSVVDLRHYDNGEDLLEALRPHDLIWAMGGNPFILRHEMRRSGFEDIVHELLDSGIVYGGDSAGALVAGTTLSGLGVELVDEPAFAERLIEDGLNLIPYIIMPHADNPTFSEAMDVVYARPDQDRIIVLGDAQAVIFNDDMVDIVGTNRDDDELPDEDNDEND